MDSQTRRLREEAKHLRPVMQIGKNGITEGSVKLLQRELEQKGLVKVKLLKAYLDATEKRKQEVGEELARLTGAALIQVVGHTIILYKRPL